MPRLLFPFIVTGILRLIAMTRPFRCPHCGANHNEGMTSRRRDDR
jgi:hypothetical protein